MSSNSSRKKSQGRTRGRTRGRSRGRSRSRSSSSSSSRSSPSSSSMLYMLPEPFSTRMLNYKNRRLTLKNNRGEVCKAPDFKVNDDDDGYTLYSDGSISINDNIVYGNIIDNTGTVLYSLPQPTGPYSKTSDHKFIMVQLNLDGLGGPFKIGSGNTSWEADVGPEIPIGSEAFLLKRQAGPDRREYFKNSIATIVHHFIEKRMDAFFIQETNDKPRVSTSDRTKVSLNSDGNFEGGYQSIIESLAVAAAADAAASATAAAVAAVAGSTINAPALIATAAAANANNTTFIEEERNIPIGTDGSYYSRGTFGDYSYVAFSVRGNYGTYPTVLTIWNHNRLGKFVACYGEDMGKLFRGVYGTIEPKNYGRPILCVHTEHGVNLVNIQAPNEPNLVKSSLYIAIKMFLSEAQIKIEVKARSKKIKVIWNPKLIVLGGDFNDAKKSIRQITINDYQGKSQACLHYIGEAPLTCCAETRYNTLNNYPLGGDYILANNPRTPITILYEYFRY